LQDKQTIESRSTSKTSNGQLPERNKLTSSETRTASNTLSISEPNNNQENLSSFQKDKTALELKNDKANLPNDKSNNSTEKTITSEAKSIIPPAYDNCDSHINKEKERTIVGHLKEHNDSQISKHHKEENEKTDCHNEGEVEKCNQEVSTVVRKRSNIT